MNRARLLLAIVSFAAVVALAYWELREQTSPGPLHASHEQVPELQAQRGCAACHGRLPGAMPRHCLHCHSAIQTQLDEARGLHGRLPSEEALACARCHAEHTGGALPLVSEAGFRAAGVDVVGLYDHAHVEQFTLTGRHVPLTCVQCHPLVDAPVIPTGQQRFLGRRQDCVACHEDPHKSTYGVDCASCHGQAQPFERAPLFVHGPAFPLTGSHAGHACVRCHAKDTAYSIAAIRRYGVTTPRQCRDCHEPPHRDGFLQEAAAAGGVPLNAICQRCHHATHKTFLSPEAQMPRRLHAASGFALEAPHDRQRCEQCHVELGKREALAKGPDLQARFAVFYPGRQPGECQVCHADPHAGQFDAGPSQGRCRACHLEISFKPAQFDVVRHEESRFRLIGAHKTVACRECHKEVDNVRRFTPLDIACTACHRDTHAGQFNAGTTRGECLACHAMTGFYPTGFDIERHAETPFRLTGAHQAVGCASCHPLEGKVRRFTPVATACAVCHKDVHAGRFDGAEHPVTVDGRKGCARCHGTASFAEVAWETNVHGRWTGYPLRGAHARATCIACHPRTSQDGTSTVPFAKAPKECAACHADPHAGQFRREGKVDCARCHTDAKPFKELVFDHQTDSRFAIDQAHVLVPCAGCHRPAELPDGGTVVRYWPLGRRCQDCHGFGTPGWRNVE